MWPSSCLLSGDSVQPTVGCAWRAQRDQLPGPVPTHNHRGGWDRGWGWWWWGSGNGSHQAQAELAPQRYGEDGMEGGEDGWMHGGGGGGGRPSALANKPQSKELFHTRPNTCCHWQLYKCVNTLEAYRKTQAGLGIVLCKLHPWKTNRLLVWGWTAFSSMCTYEQAYRIKTHTLTQMYTTYKAYKIGPSSCNQRLYSNMLYTCRDSSRPMDHSSSFLNLKSPFSTILLYRIFPFFLSI